jgi:serine/threonine-protein kinase RsbW
MPTQNLIALNIPAKADFIDVARLTLYGISNKMGFSYEDIEDMKVAVAEACNNVVIHAYKEAETGTIEIAFEMNPQELIISVSDKGTSFDYLGVAKELNPRHETKLEDITVGGLGLYLMQALMDKVEVESSQGTKVVMTKFLHAVGGRI